MGGSLREVTSRRQPLFRPGAGLAVLPTAAVGNRTVMSTALWIGVVIALLAGIIGVPLALRYSRRKR